MITCIIGRRVPGNYDTHHAESQFQIALLSAYVQYGSNSLKWSS
jgi:hypothetical protein